MNEQLETEEAQTIASLLSKLQPGFLPKEVFYEVTRLVVTPIVEVVPLRKGASGKTEVLLTKREEDDPNWPGMLHTPGTVVLATDEENSYESAFQRIANELGDVNTARPQFVNNTLHKGNRGMESALVFYSEVLGEPSVGSFYPADNLPESIVDTQVPFIEEAVRSFEARMTEAIKS
jgi:hypothetical protein